MSEGRSAARRRYPIRIGLLLLVAVLSLGGGVTASGKSKPKPKKHAAPRVACPKGERMARHRCQGPLPAPRGTPTALISQDSVSLMHLANGNLRPLPKRAVRHVPAALRHGLPSFVTNAAATSALARAETRLPGGDGTAGVAEAGPSVNGWATDVTGSYHPDDNRIGEQDVEADVTATKKAVADNLQLTGELRLATRRHLLVDKCPAADGTVPGDGLFRFTLSASATGGGASVAGSADIVPSFTAVGHTDDTGRLRTFDLRMHLTVLLEMGVRGSDGKLYSQEAPRLYVVDAQRNGIDPDHPGDGDFDLSLGGRAVAHTLLGHIIWQDDEAPKTVDLAKNMFSLYAYRLADLYKEAQQNWQTPGNCVHVSLSATQNTLSPNTSVPVTATVTGPNQPGKGLADGTYTATASAGSVAPPSGNFSGSPTHLTFTAPASGDATVTFATQSKQGKGTASLSFHVSSTYALRYTHSSQLDYSGDPEKIAAAPTQGTEDRHEKWALSTTIPLTGDPVSGLSGTASSGFTSANFHLEWDGWFGGQAGPQSCHGSVKYDLTGTNSGSAQVQKLTFSSPTSVSLRFDVGQPSGSSGTLPPAETERYVNVDTFDQCPGATNNTTSSRWYSEFSYYYIHAGMIPKADGVAEIDSGWQPGQGDVVATRTVTGAFPWTGAPGTPSTSTWTDTYEIVRR